MPWSGGVYTRGYASWSNDASLNLPISATKFDTEDNDFASGLNNCLTKDGLNTPNAAMTWGLSGAQVLALTRGNDGAVFSTARTGGTNNPALTLAVADGTGASLATSFGSITIKPGSGNNGIVIATGTQTFGNSTDNPNYTFAGSGVLTLPSGGITGFSGIITAGGFNATGSTVPANGIYLPSANTLGFATNTTAAGSISSGGAWTIPAPTAGSTLALTGLANNYTETITASSTSGQSFGLSIKGGTTNADYALRAFNQAGTQDYLDVLGTGEVYIFSPTAANSPPANTFQVGYMDIPPNGQAVNYSFALNDRGKNVQHQSASAHTFTIPANASVAFPVGSTITITNLVGGGVITLAITTDTLVWLPSGGTGSRTLTAPCIATITKIDSTHWYLSGVGIS